MEAGGFPHVQEEEEHEPSYDDEDDEDEGDEDLTPRDADEDELAVAEREYLSEMRTGMHIAEEDGIVI